MPGAGNLRARTAVLSREEQRGVEQARVANARLSLFDARVLGVIVAGKATPRWVADASNAQRVSLATLMRLGYVEANEGGVKPSDALRHSLGLD